MKNGAESYFSHFTNWAWTINALFWLSELLSYADCWGTITFIVYTVFLWITNCLTWVVFWLVWIVLNDNPGILEDETKSHGGPYSSGFVYNMNTVFHYLPAIMMVYFMWARTEVIKGVFAALSHWIIMNLHVYNKKDLLIYLILISLGVSVVLPFAIIGLYLCANNPVSIYGTTTPVAVIVAAAIGVVIVHSFSVCVYFAITGSYVHLHKKKPDYTQQHQHQSDTKPIIYETERMRTSVIYYHETMDGEAYLASKSGSHDSDTESRIELVAQR